MNETRGFWRGKCIYNGEWVKGDLVCDKYFDGSIGYFIFERDFDNSKSYTIDPSTLGECTGLHDKNGKLIFEGDVIAYEDETPGQYEYHDSLFINRGIIKFGDGQFYFTNSIAATMDDLLNGGILDCEVIGNIHDNP